MGAMRIPVWLTLGFAAVIAVYGIYRMTLAFRTAQTDTQPPPPTGRLGFRAMGRRTHFLMGLIYLLLAGSLIATTFGWNPLGSMIGPQTAPPAKAAAPSKPGSIPIDQLPQKN
jgi:hypothetical protein